MKSSASQIRERRRRHAGTAAAAIALLSIWLIGCTAAAPLSSSPGGVHLDVLSCACATVPVTHEPGWTPSAPPPLSLSEARSRTARFTGVSMATDGNWFDMAGRVVVETTGTGATALIDGNSGEVVLAVRTDRLPGTGKPIVTSAAATAAATAFLKTVSLSTAGLTARTQSIASDLDAGFVVDFAGADNSPDYRVFINAIDGRVFAFEIGSRAGSSVPLVGRAEAVRRAQAAIPEPGQLVLNADLQLDTFTGVAVWTWQIGLGVPTATQADVFQGGGYVTVDATSGTTTVVKKG